MHGIAINNSHDVTFANILIDNAAGAEVMSKKKPWYCFFFTDFFIRM